jgi:hypothetical protein
MIYLSEFSLGMQNGWKGLKKSENIHFPGGRGFLYPNLLIPI